MWYVYLIKSKFKNYKYIGITENIEQRLKKHNEGSTKSTRPYRPFESITIIKECSNRQEARKWEKYYKSGKGREELKKHTGNGAVGSAHACLLQAGMGCVRSKIKK